MPDAASAATGKPRRGVSIGALVDQLPASMSHATIVLTFRMPLGELQIPPTMYSTPSSTAEPESSEPTPAVVGTVLAWRHVPDTGENSSTACVIEAPVKPPAV